MDDVPQDTGEFLAVSVAQGDIATGLSDYRERVEQLEALLRAAQSKVHATSHHRYDGPEELCPYLTCRMVRQALTP